MKLARECDVLVAGGGSAGFAAAVNAARTGARTLLIERGGMLGGMATGSLVHSVCGLYRLGDHARMEPVNPGFPMEFAWRLVDSGGSEGPVRMGRVDVLPHTPAYFAALCDRMVRECPNLEVWSHSPMSQAHGTNSVELVTGTCHGRRFEVEAKQVIDTTGDAVVAAAFSGVTEMAPSVRLERPAFIFFLHGVDVALLDGDGRVRLAHHLVEAVRSRQLDEGALGAQFRVTGRGSEVSITIDFAAAGDYDPTDPAWISQLEAEGRSLAVALTRHLKREEKAFAHAHVAAFPSRIGVRESRRVVGRTVVTGTDVLEGTVPDDTVAWGAWPMETRDRHPARGVARGGGEESVDGRALPVERPRRAGVVARDRHVSRHRGRGGRGGGAGGGGIGTGRCPGAREAFPVTAEYTEYPERYPSGPEQLAHLFA
jgi:hypothetical protein